MRRNPPRQIQIYHLDLPTPTPKKNKESTQAVEIKFSKVHLLPQISFYTAKIIFKL